MKTMAWKTFARKLQNGELEVNAWGQDERWVDLVLISSTGARTRVLVELTGKKVEL